ncbi:MAG: DUF262 domain-containing protein, partial [Eggerthellaceae bacterium]|nr:DUF262 domain-containing protein [Eggerthellaceae bacterium]
MDNENLPLQSLTIDELFNSAEPRTFEIPIYQRNYAWGRNEIGTLVQDVLDASETKGRYHIGTLVVYSKGDNVYEIIDGQQRVTTIYLLLKALEKSRISAEAVHRIQFRTTNKLTYRARSKSSRTLEKIEKLGEGGVLTEVKGEDDRGIVEGYKFVCEVLDDMESDVLAKFAEYFKKNVIIVFYEVPMDIDLNHYFEVMNSRGEQLEQHEVVKADLLSAFVDIEPKNENAGGSNEDSSKFTFIWECCSDMSTYVQKKFYDSFKSPTEGKILNEGVLGKTFDTFIAGSFDEIEIGT